MVALEDDFEESTGHELKIVIGSTGKIYAQIKHGAPYDVFLAADQARPERLVSEGTAVSGSRFTYARGQLVLWSPAVEALNVDSLTAPAVKRIAIANPELAPYGRAAEQVLQGLNLHVSLSTKLVLGENIGQAFAFVSTGNAQLGFVSKAQVLSLPDGQRGTQWSPASALHDPIDQDGVLLNGGSKNPAALAFMDYLKSPDAEAIIMTHGYEIP